MAYALKGAKSSALHPQSVPDSPTAGTNVMEQSIRFVDPETGGVYYWFIGVNGRTLVLLVVGGPPNNATSAAFEWLRTLVRQR